MSDLTWTPGMARLDSLELWEYNPKWMTKTRAKRLLESWRDLSQYQTLAVGPSGECYDGHQRVKTLIAAGYPGEYELRVLRSNRPLTDAERRRVILESTVGTVGSLDWDKLAAWDVSVLQTSGIDAEFLATLNNDAANLAKMLEAESVGATADDPGAQTDKAQELLEKWGVALGDVWEIESRHGGVHRIVCGDCTDKAVVDRVMMGEKADMVFTDPPYNVSSEGRNYAADAPTQKKTYEAIKNAEWDKDFDISTIFPSLELAMGDDCAVYVCTSHWLVQTVWEWMWKWSKFCSYVVWCKPNPAPSLAKRHWTWATELIAYAVRGKHTSNFPSEGHALNWWEIVSPTHSTGHPTEKPITIPSRAIEFSSNKGDIVFDGFLGSGTTLVACENLGRKGRGIEIAPGYVAVTLERLAGMGLEPRLQSNGR